MKITIKNMHQNNQDNNKQIIQKRDDNTKKSRNSQGKYITYSPNIDNLMMNLKFVTHLSIHNITCIHNCIFGYNCKKQVNVV